jgi:hypothetical protein
MIAADGARRAKAIGGPRVMRVQVQCRGVGETVIYQADVNQPFPGFSPYYYQLGTAITLAVSQ